MRRGVMGAICGALIALAAAPAAGANFDDPLYFSVPHPPPPNRPIVPPPFGYLNRPCGLAVDSAGQVYVSDYYHRSVDVFTSAKLAAGLDYNSQPLTAYSGLPNPHVGKVDDPCGLAIDGNGTLYLNNYHRDVARFPAPIALGANTVIDSGDPANPYANPTGVAVDPASDHVYVDDRTYIAEYDATGSALAQIGASTLGDGFGIAVSGFATTTGFIYVPDASTATVKVYDPTFSTTVPKYTITGPPGGFGSLLDSSVAVDDASGEVYVVDTRGPQFTEQPEATVYVFAADGSYEGRLKHNTVNAAPTGIAVDNSGTETQSRVYLTSGITEYAGIYAYPPGAATTVALPPLGGGSSSLSGDGLSTPALPGSAGVADPSASAAGARSPSLPDTAAGKDGESRAAKSHRRTHRRHHRRQGHRRATRRGRQ